MKLFGESEYVLRAPSMLAGSLALVLFASFVRRQLRPRVALVATAAFAISWPAIYWSASAKPYAFDMLAATIILMSWFRFMSEGGRARGLAYCGLLQLLSIPACIMLAGIGATFGITALRRRDARLLRRFSWTVAAWVAVAVPFAIMGARSASELARRYMVWYWRSGFLSWHGFWSVVVQVILLIIVFFRSAVGYPLVAIPLVFTIGVLAWATTEPAFHKSMLALVAPFIVVVFLSILHEYPLGSFEYGELGGRVVLFLAPCLFAIVAIGIEQGDRRWGGVAFLIGSMVITLPLASAMIEHIPMEPLSTRPAYTYVARHIEKGDTLVVNVLLQHTFRYYAPHVGLDAVPAVMQPCGRPFRPPSGSVWIVDDTAARPSTAVLLGQWAEVRTAKMFGSVMVRRFRVPEGVHPMPDSVFVGGERRICPAMFPWNNRPLEAGPGKGNASVKDGAGGSGALSRRAVE